MSNHEQDVEIGRLVREHGERRKEYIALSSRLKRIGGGLQPAVGALLGADVGSYSANTVNAKNALESIASEIDLSALLGLVDEHIRLTNRLKQDQETLQQTAPMKT